MESRAGLNCASQQPASGFEGPHAHSRAKISLLDYPRTNDRAWVGETMKLQRQIFRKFDQADRA